MKKVIYFFILSLTLASNATAAGIAPTNRPTTTNPSTSFDSIWVDYDVKEGDLRGMMIHLSFSAYNMKEMDAYVAIYFEYQLFQMYWSNQNEPLHTPWLE